jgi:hypothetical protein
VAATWRSVPVIPWCIPVLCKYISFILQYGRSIVRWGRLLKDGRDPGAGEEADHAYGCVRTSFKAESVLTVSHFNSTPTTNTYASSVSCRR